MQENINRKTMVEVAKLYYLGGLSQSEIAQMLGISRPKVSRILALGKRSRIIKFVIADAPNVNEQIAEMIRSEYGLSKVIIVPSDTSPHITRRSAGAAASIFLNMALRDGMNIGLSCGRTLSEFCNAFQPVSELKSCQVVQLSGNLRTPIFDLDAWDLVKKFARKLSADCAQFDAPMIVANEMVWDLLMKKPEIKEHFARFHNLDIAICGIGSSQPEESIAYEAGQLSLEESTALADAGFAADICGNRIYKDGSIKDNALSKRVVAIPLEALRAVPIVVGIAVGKNKAKPIVAAAKGKLVNVLVTDEIAAILISSQIQSGNG